MLLSGAALLSGCEMDSQQATTAPPPASYETMAPIMQNVPPGDQAAVSTDTTTQAPAASKQRPPVRTRTVNHSVGSGESLWSLSRKYETTVQEIRDANQLSGDMIRAGQVLKIPTSLPEGDPFSGDGGGAGAAPATPPPSPPVPAPLSGPSAENQRKSSGSSHSSGPLKTASSSSWTVTPPVTPPTSSGSSAPQYRIPEPVILPPPSEN